MDALAAGFGVFLVFLRLGLTSFGGPVAHLGYFHDEFVVRRRWLTPAAYADLVALCQFLPGPASSQVGMGLGLARAGYAGALGAWAGFTLPSAVLLIGCATGMASHGAWLPAGVLHGLKVAAVAVVAQAVWGMGRKLCTDVPRVLLMAAAAACVVLVPSAWGQVLVIAAAGILGILGSLRRLSVTPATAGAGEQQPAPLSRRAGVLWLLLFVLLLVGLPMAARDLQAPPLAMAAAFYRSGALVFGGGHVVLPLLQAEVVTTGWVNQQTFLAGYGLAQAVPGPLFTFAGFLGAAATIAPAGWLGGAMCLLAIFTPSFLLLAGALPFWHHLRHSRRAQGALAGMNAAVVGVLLAALVDPVWTGAIHAWPDLALAALALAALSWWRLPPWLVVLACAAAGWCSVAWPLS
ncbi:chromate transporter [Duganella sp. Leaf126]|uniref:chromate efflux transporter n=1 Tax=Duganella sp. Leaf126 TaxID=1736266 RepID=UPI0006FD9AA8|nr:chromate efflux transporter [Duganella sp. Leaf126]KQQ32514.1 chromate transporter [Duganella sp. Leaf126]